ncbi:CPBP family intramembrane glutamic endopeptidase [Amnibacterium flavum]|uniref:CPBP family intramembrane metalloprotease domain-containing protein n=1 Tax=Amnibacterium flavum TaxID=2173173 RepID=A0A2V1HMA4_9MICO|nr:CPBP family intramembrane glutamic endopeptidase [Amnibacterium flavum]PVZ93756.1 CPBP family intramembrane metalloprotease domain-containing protein [Amnibacterium flavum]
MSAPRANGYVAQNSRSRTWWEIGIVLSLSLGASAVYSIVRIIDRSTRDIPLAQQSATINQSASDRPLFDLVYQLLGIAFDLAPVALVLWLLWRPAQSAFRRIGFDATRPGRDIGSGFLLAAVVGIPGLGLYLLSRTLGFSVDVRTSGLDDYWWTIPILILSALRAALTEEIIVVGYLFTRLRELGWRPWSIIIGSAILRGSYHLYQGWGGFVGNLAMGILFGWAYNRWGRTAPLIVCHFILDIVSFVGYPLAVLWFPTVFISGG